MTKEASIDMQRPGGEQYVAVLRGAGVEQLELPAATAEVVPGVRWGRFEHFFTPAFWVARSWIDGIGSPREEYMIGASLREEVAACLLGGYGMPAELGLAAFYRLRERGLLNGAGDRAAIERALLEPLVIGGRRVRYRYPRAKAGFLASALRKLEGEAPPMHSGVVLRGWLITFPGIGFKTASWITRNVLHSDEVAILDVHVVRAGVLMGLFSPRCSAQREYLDMEGRLVEFANAVRLKLSTFDSVIWRYMRQFSALALDVLREVETGSRASVSDSCVIVGRNSRYRGGGGLSSGRTGVAVSESEQAS